VIVYDISSSQNSQVSSKNKQKLKKKEQEQSKDLMPDAVKFDKPVFKAIMKDATESISQLFFIRDFKTVLRDDSSNEIDSDK
jgi:hypothetical protein